VRGADGAVIGAIGIAGPSQRLSLEGLVEFSEPLIKVTAAVSVRLGYTARLDHEGEPWR
jgi:DNA-binding IclR family transcriptional regulator